MPPQQGSLKDIKHVVLLIQENRSFDHSFGTLASVRGFGDPVALRLSNGKSVFFQPDPENPNGCLLPFHLDTWATSAQKIPSLSRAQFGAACRPAPKFPDSGQRARAQEKGPRKQTPRDRA